MLQIQLDAFIKYWNNHCIHTQKNKPNMSGSTLRHSFTVLAPPAQNCKISVNRQIIHMLCSQIPVAHEEAMCWVDDVFDVVATQAYEAIGIPLPQQVSHCQWLGYLFRDGWNNKCVLNLNLAYLIDTWCNSLWGHWKPAPQIVSCWLNKHGLDFILGYPIDTWSLM